MATIRFRAVPEPSRKTALRWLLHALSRYPMIEQPCLVAEVPTPHLHKIRMPSTTRYYAPIAYMLALIENNLTPMRSIGILNSAGQHTPVRTICDKV